MAEQIEETALRTRSGKYIHLALKGSVQAFCGVRGYPVKGGFAAVTCQACRPNARGEHN